MLDLHDSRTGKQYIWNGWHTVNIYNAWGEEVDCFTFGFGTEPTFEDFCAAVNRRIQYENE